eukprot:GEMP01022791.1.p1 GENE.GEMP01022791.1~~GEMP01022791.1.p1  ORF type:complete len:556 (+),score=138.86 GEMP01022791.1:130-1797(+)
MLAASVLVAWMALVDGQGSASTRASSPTVFMGYHCNWHQWRGDMKFTADLIQGDKITHVNYAFAMIGSKDFVENGVKTPYQIRHFESNDLGASGGYATLNKEIKGKYPHLKTLISVGGWNFNVPKGNPATKNVDDIYAKQDPGWTEKIFSEMVSTQTNRGLFIRSCLAFCKEHEFDGIDLDWEYPGAEDRGGKPADKENFALLLKEMRAAIDNDGKKLLFTAAVGVGLHRVEAGYDIPALNKYLDFVNLMTYDLYGAFDKPEDGTRIHSQLHNFDKETMSGAWAVQYWIDNGMDRNKLTLGWATYSRSYKLASTTANQGIGSPFAGYGAKQKYSVQEGTATYQEMLDILKDPAATTTHDPKRCAAYLQKGNLWMGYDDLESMACKAQYVKDEGLLGAFVWSLPEDDFKNGSPLISAFSKAICLPPGVCPPGSDTGGTGTGGTGTGGTGTSGTGTGGTGTSGTGTDAAVEKSDKAANGLSTAVWIALILGIFLLLACVIVGLLMWKKKKDEPTHTPPPPPPPRQEKKHSANLNAPPRGEKKTSRVAKQKKRDDGRE